MILTEDARKATRLPAGTATLQLVWEATRSKPNHENVSDLIGALRLSPSVDALGMFTEIIQYALANPGWANNFADVVQVALEGSVSVSSSQLSFR